MSASACHIGGPINVNPGELALVYGSASVVVHLLAMSMTHSLVPFRERFLRQAGEEVVPGRLVDWCCSLSIGGGSTGSSRLMARSDPGGRCPNHC